MRVAQCSLRRNGAKKRLPGPRMSRDRLVPLIIAVALFMENMDATIIATSLPAIAADIGANPLALKLAITSYLLSLAVFIPASGWTADRFGARTVFRAAIAIFVIGSIGCALANSLEGFVVARIVQGMGGAMMTPVGRLVLVRSIDKHQPGRRHGLGHDAGAGRPDHRPAGRRLHHHLRELALDLPHQRADRADRHRAGDCATSRTCGSRGWSASTSSAWCSRARASPAWPSGSRWSGSACCRRRVVAALIAGGAIFMARLCGARAAHAGAGARFLAASRIPTFRANVIGGSLFRLGIGALSFLLPLMLQLGFDYTPLQSGLLTFTAAVGAFTMKSVAARDHPPLRLPPRADRERADQLGLHGGLRGLHAGHAVRRDGGGAADRRLLPLAAVHRHQHDRLCGRRAARG